MPDISDDKVTATTYPPADLYAEWCVGADERNIPISQYIIRMVEAGRQEINLDTLTSDSVQELRQQRTDLQQELARERRRVEQLEQQLHHTAQVDILEYIEKNPGATTPEIIQHVADTVPSRVASHLDVLEGDAIKHGDDGYHLQDTQGEIDTPSDVVSFIGAGVDG
jgi:predicted RNase H-like nuclease (RuvC/YqgF family)